MLADNDESKHVMHWIAVVYGMRQGEANPMYIVSKAYRGMRYPASIPPRE
jgi:hypothetical protein